jgi:hypothetical protein
LRSDRCTWKEFSSTALSFIVPHCRLLGQQTAVSSLLLEEVSLLLTFKLLTITFEYLRGFGVLGWFYLGYW